jgi:hypothetical protein
MHHRQIHVRLSGLALHASHVALQHVAPMSAGPGRMRSDIASQCPRNGAHRDQRDSTDTRQCASISGARRSCWTAASTPASPARRRCRTLTRWRWRRLT